MFRAVFVHPERDVPKHRSHRGDVPKRRSHLARVVADSFCGGCVCGGSVTEGVLSSIAEALQAAVGKHNAREPSAAVHANIRGAVGGGQVNLGNHNPGAAGVADVRRRAIHHLAFRAESPALNHLAAIARFRQKSARVVRTGGEVLRKLSASAARGSKTHAANVASAATTRVLVRDADRRRRDTRT